ncbi:methyltransferase domain-containing protein [Paenibacillus filicis]|uniref:Methyltransferase domain-containing protein n=1 Tax=Paenibacillus gyeongsangnamensis TaxID=3388067 RepID=A0ABT4QEX4_9BACL|nr:methyltransferase domain-containing protein [Paenibacillus filicis]MCZ8515423.1 methyltransferase domain-containing protein [Paenibacillus filicis]
MTMDTASSRAELSGKLTNVLDARTLSASHRRLSELVHKGIRVLDVGCGTGAITRGIAEAVGPGGRVVGIDSNPKLIDKARQMHGTVPGLTFETGEIYKLDFKESFDMVTAARVFIWLSDPVEALHRMKHAAKIGGRILISDYNHLKISWQPEPPASMLHFYKAYLKWRADAGIRNDIADCLPGLFQDAGLHEIVVTPQHEITKRSDPDFESRIALWADTASSRGAQMVRDGYMEESDVISAEQEYREWIFSEAQSLTMYMLAVEGTR